MSGFVYIWRDRKHNRYYIGSHWGKEDDGYICSSTWMRNSYNRRKEDFKRRILSKVSSSRSDLFREEEKWLQMIKPIEIKVRYYNFNRTTQHWVSDENRAKTIQERISKKTKEAMSSPEVREKYLAGLAKRDNKSSNVETKAKRSESMKKTMAEKFPVEDRRVRMEFGSEEYREFMRNSTSELWNRPGHRKLIGSKISAALKGKPKPNMLWWNNGSINTRKPKCPGDEWVRGKLRI